MYLFVDKKDKSLVVSTCDEMQDKPLKMAVLKYKSGHAVLAPLYWGHYELNSNHYDSIRIDEYVDSMIDSIESFDVIGPEELYKDWVHNFVATSLMAEAYGISDDSLRFWLKVLKNDAMAQEIKIFEIEKNDNLHLTVEAGVTPLQIVRMAIETKLSELMGRGWHSYSVTSIVRFRDRTILLSDIA